MSKSRFIKGAFIMSTGLMITKVLGLLFVFPFAKMVGQQGQALYSYAYVPYSVFIDLATLGIPMGVAKFVAKYNSVEQYEVSYKVFKISFRWMALIGVILCVLLVYLSPWYASLVLAGKDKLTNSVSDVEFVIQIVSLALIVIPMVSLLRGFFQGFQDMVPSTISQIIEQGVRVVFILISTYLIIYQLEGTVVDAVAFAVFAAFLSGVAALITLLHYFRKFRLKYDSYLLNSKPCETKTRKLILELFKYSLPFAIYGLNFAVYQLVDSVMFNRALLINGYNDPEILYGIYAFEVQKLIMIPVTIAIGFSASLMPSITSAYTRNDMKLVKDNIRLGVQLIFFITMPIIVMFMLYSDTIYNFLFDNNIYGGNILKSYAPVALLFCFNNISMSILQGLNQQRYLLKSLLLGVIIKSALNYPLLIMFGVDGAILATSLGYLTAITLNFIKISKSANLHFKYIINSLFVIMIINLVMGVSLFFLDRYYFYKLIINDTFINNILYLGVSGLIGMVIYIVLNFIFGVIDVIAGANITFDTIIQYIKRNKNYY